MSDHIELPESDEDLLDQCAIETFRSGGPGGQNQNRRETGVRLRHGPSGLVVSSRTERTQHLNKMRCLERLRRKVDLLNYEPEVRVPTKMPRVQKKKRLEAKSRQSSRKQMRKRPTGED